MANGIFPVQRTLLRHTRQIADLQNNTLNCCNSGALPSAAAPTFEPPAGTYEFPFLLYLESDTPAAVIYYTIDGSNPTSASTLYEGGFALLDGATVRAIAYATGYTPSDISSSTYTVDNPQARTPTFSPAAGTYATAQLVTITSPDGGTIHYTVDGSIPTAGSPTYATPIALASTTTVRAIAIVGGFDDSAVGSATYTISALVVANPVFSPVAGAFSSSVDITITTTTPFASIYFTVDGSTPTIASILYTTPFTLTATTTVKALAVRSGYTNSGVTTGVYTETAAIVGFWGNWPDPDIPETDWNANLSAWIESVSDYNTLDLFYSYGASSVPGDYQYYIVINSAAAASTPLGFANGATLFPYSPLNFAGAAEGYNDVDSNGWPCKLVTYTSGDGEVYRVYRLLDQHVGATELRVRQF